MAVIDFSLVIACYKDAPHLFRNVQELAGYLNGTCVSYEMIFVEDCSPDNTAEEVRTSVAWLKERSIGFKLIFHAENTGRGRAVSEGIKVAEGGVVGFIDIDLEQVIEGTLPMIQMVRNEDADVVVGRRALGSPKAKPLRVLSSYVYRCVVHLIFDLPVADTESGLKVFHRRKILPFLEQVQDSRWFWDTEIIHRAWVGGLRVCERWIVFVEDRHKASAVRLIHDTWAYLKEIYLYRRQSLSRQVSGDKALNSY